MTLNRSILGICIAMLLVCSSAARAADTTLQVEEAVTAAEAWLALIDGGDSDPSWDESAALFRTAVTKEQWAQALAASRAPLGDVTSRKVKSTQYATTLPGAPDGDYVVIQFETSFANKASAIETVTPMKDPDGVWRVSGYYIK